jgi:large subunit ribosomal protein L13e
MPKHNNILPNIHLRKHWQRWVKTYFNQPGSKRRRLEARRAKAAASFPKPIQKLRSVVASTTSRYSGKPRIGKGFSLDELKEAGISPQFAQTIGIVVDHRRKNRSTEGLQKNVARLNAYKSKLVVIPTKAGKPHKKGYGTVADSNAKAADQTQNTHADVLAFEGVNRKAKATTVSSAQNKFNAKYALAVEHVNQKWDGKRRAKAEEQAAAPGQ